MLDTANTVFIEELRQNTAFNNPVFDHIGNAGWGAKVILKNKKFPLFITNNIDAAYVGINTPRRHNADDFTAEIPPLVDQLRGDYAILDDPLFAIQVAKKKV